MCVCERASLWGRVFVWGDGCSMVLCGCVSVCVCLVCVCESMSLGLCVCLGRCVFYFFVCVCVCVWLFVYAFLSLEGFRWDRGKRVDHRAIQQQEQGTDVQVLIRLCV